MAFLTKRGMVQEDVCGVNFSENTSPLARNSTGLLSGRKVATDIFSLQVHDLSRNMLEKDLIKAADDFF